MRIVTRLLKLELVLSLSALLLGCVGVIPVPQQIRTAQGIHEKVDLGFIKPGTTTRLDVSQKLKFIDTGLTSSRYILGRWSTSTSAGWLITGGIIAGEDNGGRRWKSENILVEFDANGVVIDATRISDSNIVSALAPVAAENHLPDAPVELQIKYWKNGYKQSIPSKITLSPDVFSFEELGTLKKKHKFAVPRRDVVRISTPISKPNGDPVYTTQTIHFATRLKKLGGPSEKEVDIELSLRGLVDLISYVSQNRRGVSFSPVIDDSHFLSTQSASIP